MSAVLMEWRETTIDVDLKIDPEPSGIYEAFSRLKNQMDINIELAAPDDFIPTLPGWKERSRFVGRHGQIDFSHHDFYSQALAKIERFHDRDEGDVHAMASLGLIKVGRLMNLFDEIEPEFIRFPAIEPLAFRQRLETFIARV